MKVLYTGKDNMSTCSIVIGKNKDITYLSGILRLEPSHRNRLIEYLQEISNKHKEDFVFKVVYDDDNT